MIDWLRAVSPSPALTARMLEASPAVLAADALTRVFSPYQFNPTNFHPLRGIVEEMLDTDAVRSARGPQLFINATNVRDGKPRIFQGDEITADAILASACLPTLYQAIEIDDPRTGRREAYWDGGYTGNPALYPLFYRTRTPDIVIIHINPLYREELPKTSSEIMSRINEISFNASLLRELRNIEFVNRLLDRGVIAEGAMKRNNVHSVSDDKLMNQLGIVTKMTISRTLLLQLKDAGRAAMDALPDRAPAGPRQALVGEPPGGGQLRGRRRLISATYGKPCMHNPCTTHAPQCLRHCGKRGGRRSGDPCRTRTCNLRIRSPLLYPVELRGRGGALNASRRCGGSAAKLSP